MQEVAYHKLKRVEDYTKIQGEGFRPATPAERHWLGEGIYFFLDPNGERWATRWPCNRYDSRTDSRDGIIKTTVDTSAALDLRDNDIRNKTHQAVNALKLKLKFNAHLKDQVPRTDGAAFALLFKLSIFKEIVSFTPTSIIANFDNDFKDYRVQGSGVFLTIEDMPVGRNAQIQACVIDSAVIGSLCLFT